MVRWISPNFFGNAVGEGVIRYNQIITVYLVNPYKLNTNGCLFIVEDLRGETMVSPSKKLDDLIHLAELCVDLLQQNEEHYAEVSTQRFSEITIDINELRPNNI